MNIRQFTNPRHTYDGYFETYFIRPYFDRYANFKAGESVKSCILSLVAWLIVTLGVVGILLGLIGLIGPEAGITTAITVGIIWGLLSIVPIVAVIMRVFNGKPEKDPTPHLLGVDTLLWVSCLLFFIFGLLMMVTTMHSETLDPNARYVPEADSAVSEDEYVVEEPIFTYQDEGTPSVTESEDTLSDVNEPDLASPEESYDPSIEVNTDPAFEEAVNDTI
ncbi:MAG: hypothetical protein K2G67_06195 [Muribaculaceae bacterium]|nr:hypothetical protein [Muribaculaceae bacterium]